MARVDDYINAKKIAVEKLSAESFEDITQRAGFEAEAENHLRIPFLNRIYKVRFPDFEFQDAAEPEKEVPIQEQVLILHYLMGEGGRSLSAKNWVAYREIPGASFYFSAFVKRAIDPLKKVFGQNIAGLVRASEKLNGQKIDIGDAGFDFRLFPNVPLQLILWEGDDEFPPEGNILFQEGVEKILSPEDIAWLGGMIVYRLAALSH
ncbi:MAG: hypothetical protein B6245_07290 [Desulfobacteraceae bacterium 4572_88]|nr:MAG: hypothetical protein B6245_07290 [Desulfobacteraceae bacterium 4572_88]